MRARSARAEARKAEIEALYRYRTPVQACPRGCGFRELARRDPVVKSGFLGRAKVAANFIFETTNCPECGAALVSECGRCEAEILAPVVDLCRKCGLPQPWASERRVGTDRTSIRQWRQDEDKKDEKKKKKQQEQKSLVNDPAKPLYFSKKKKKKKKKGARKAAPLGDIWIIDGDISQLAVDAVVSNDDVYGQMWSQAARAIKQAAGDGVERLAQEGKPFQLGHAWMTTAGNLRHMRGIIHVASTSRYGKSNIGSARQCLAAALQLAAKQEFKSIGVSAFGTGPGGIKRDEWFEMFAETAVDFLSGPSKPKRAKDKGAPLSIVLVLFEPPKFEKEVKKLREAVRRAWVKLDEPADGEPVRIEGLSELNT